MFNTERHQIILNLLNRSGKVLVKDLAAQFNLTEDSIRKDLATLESDGLLKRTYGGAVSLQERALMTEANRRRMTQVAAKRAIAAKAFSFIEPKQLVFIDISSISIALADLLSNINFNVSVLTNMTDALSILSRNPHIEIFFAGGSINPARDGFTDSLALNFIDQFNPDVAFIAAAAVNFQLNAAQSHSTSSGSIKAHVINRSKKAFLLAESSKLNRAAHFSFATLDNLTIISDLRPDNVPAHLHFCSA